MTPSTDPARGIVVAVFTDGRADLLDRTLASFRDHVTGPITRTIVFDDSADPAYGAHLEDSYPDFAIISAGRRRGFGGTIRNAWSILAGSIEPWVFHLEDDFTFTRDVDLREMAYVLAADRDLVQLALVRQPWNDLEREAGGLIPHLRDRAKVEDHWVTTGYNVDGTANHAEWMTHRGWFTTNPSLYPTSLCRLGWPEGDQSEGHFTRQLLTDPATRFGYWGGGAEWVEHIGTERVGTGY